MGRLLDILDQYDGDVEGVCDRFLGDEELLLQCLLQFAKDQGFQLFETAIMEKEYQQAFEYAHGLKGVTGNLGLTPLYDELCKVVENLRAENYGNIQDDFLLVKVQYRLCMRMMKAIEEEFK